MSHDPGTPHLPMETDPMSRKTMLAALVCVWSSSSLALPGALAAQTVSTVKLSETISLDGLFMASDGTLYGAGGYAGKRIVTIGREGVVTEYAGGFAATSLAWSCRRT